MTHNDPAVSISYNWVNVPQSLFVALVNDETQRAFAEIEKVAAAQSSTSFLSVTMVDQTGAPWDNETIVSAIQQREHRQMVILTPTTDAYAVALTAMSLEHGYDVFCVVAKLESRSFFESNRLVQLGARVLSASQFLDELNLGSLGGG